MPSGASRADTVNVLFTSAGRRVELLQAFRKAHQDLGIGGRLVVTDIDALAPTIQVADTSYLVPPTDDPGFVPAIAGICSRERIQLIFPLIDPDIPALARARGVLEQSGARLVALDAEGARTTYDKWATVDLFRQSGVAHPRTWLGSALPPEGVTFPAFVKPRFGSAGKFGLRADDQAGLDSLLRYVPDPVVQEYLQGAEITNDISCGLQGEVWAVVSRRRIEVRWGEVAKGVTERHPQVEAGCVAVARALRAVGPITLQCILARSGPVFTEINARFGGGLPLGIAAGVPSPAWYLAQAAGRPVEPPPLGTYRTGLHLTRYDSSYYLTETDVARIERRRI